MWQGDGHQGDPVLRPIATKGLVFVVTGRRRQNKGVVLGVGAALVASIALAACGTGSGDSGPPTLTWYMNPDVGNLDASKGGQATIAKNCTKDASGKYDINVELLPNEASQQREQLVRRLAAGDTSIDLMSLDPAFTAEFANAKFLAPIPEGDESQYIDGVLEGSVKAASFDDKLVAVPFWSNTQVLWYRKSVAEKAGLDMSQPVTWKQVIDAAAETKSTVQVQAKKYEGYSVWINALISSAGGEIVSNVEAGKDAKIDVDSEAGKQAATVIKQLVDAGVANPALSTSTEAESVAGFVADNGGFMVNWEYVYADPSVAPIKDDVGWAPYPQVIEGEQSKPPIGGINIGVSEFSKNKDLAYEATKCITSAENEKLYSLNSGNQPSRESVYDDPEVKAKYPMAPLWKQSIENAATRPLTPYWTDISGALFSSWHTPGSVDPDTTPEKSQKYITDVLNGKALL